MYQKNLNLEIENEINLGNKSMITPHVKNVVTIASTSFNIICQNLKILTLHKKIVALSNLREFLAYLRLVDYRGY